MPHILEIINIFLAFNLLFSMHAYNFSKILVWHLLWAYQTYFIRTLFIFQFGRWNMYCKYCKRHFTHFIFRFKCSLWIYEWRYYYYVLLSLMILSNTFYQNSFHNSVWLMKLVIFVLVFIVFFYESVAYKSLLFK